MRSTPKAKSPKSLVPEIIPQSDQFLYGLHPRIQLGLQGHEKTSETMCQLFNQNKAPHGFLLTGKQGIGKATFVYHLIRALERKGNAITPADIYSVEKDMVYRKIEILSHGNLKIIRRSYNFKTGKFYQSIRREEMQELKPFFAFKPHSNGKRYVIIDSFDDCIHGENKVPNEILKTLEEPPENCYFFIIAHKEGLVLPTIKSRCMAITMTPPNTEQVTDIIKNIPNFKPHNLDKILPLANGSVRLAMIYADNLWFSAMTAIKKALFKSIPAGSVLPIQALRDKAYDSTLTHSEYMFVFHLITTRAISDNAKFATEHGHHASAFASGVIFDKIHDLFIKAEEYNFTAPEVIDRVVACLDYYHFIKQEVSHGS
jgi:DNA polymerase III subunit delta'